MNENFNLYSQYYDLIYHDKSYLEKVELPAVYHFKPASRNKTFENENILVERYSKSIKDIHQNTIDVHFDILIKQKDTGACASLQENHLMRHFSIQEINFIADLTGFSVLKSEELITKNEPGLDTWALTFVLQKTSELV